MCMDLVRGKAVQGGSGPGARDGGQGDIPKESNTTEDCSREAAQKIVICKRHWSHGTVSHQ